MARTKPPVVTEAFGALADWTKDRGEHSLARAELLCKTVLDDDPDQPDACYVLGLVKDARGLTDEAAALIERALIGVGYRPAFGAYPPLPDIAHVSNTQHLLKKYNEEKVFRTGDIDVFYTDDLLGGGTGFGQEYLGLLYREFASRGRVFRRVFEWCAGPGFIGFSILSHGLADSLCVADVHSKAVRALRHTVYRNRLHGTVAVYQSDGMADIPDHEQWDLIVGNPPHFKAVADDYKVTPGVSRIRHDIGWRLHEDLFAKGKRHLAPDGVMILCENGAGSSPGDFTAMIERNGLRMTGVQRLETYGGFYYLRVEHAA